MDERIREERTIVSKYETKLKCMSLFYILLSIFILLNSCIGFSSSPYYERYTSCEKYNLTTECISLRHRVDVIYTIELVGSVVLVVHGIIGMILLENMKVIWIARVLEYYSKVTLVVYPMLIIARVIYYANIVPILQPASQEQEIDSSLTWFTSLLTVNVQNQSLALFLTLLMFSIYTTCFMFDFCFIQLCHRMVKTLTDYEQRKKMEQDPEKKSLFVRTFE